MNPRKPRKPRKAETLLRYLEYRINNAAAYLEIGDYASLLRMFDEQRALLRELRRSLKNKEAELG